MQKNETGLLSHTMWRIHFDTIDNLKQKVVGGAVDEQEEKEESKEDVESPESGDADEQRTT